MKFKMSKKLIKTRASATCPVFGYAKDISPNASQLPTYEEVMKCYFGVRIELKGDGSKQASSATVASVVASKVEQVWKRASLPVLSRERIIKLILAYNKKYQNLIKPIKGNISDFLQTKLDTFKSDSKRLFDISCCKCLDFERCSCEKKRKVPKVERAFLQDQRSDRKMQIGGVDIVLTRSIEKRVERNQKELRRQLEVEEPIPSTSGIHTAKRNTVNVEAISDSSSEVSTDEEYKTPVIKKQKVSTVKHQQMRTSLTNTARVADLTGTSNRAVAKIVNAVLEDFNMISEENQSKVIDKNKIRRELSKTRKKLQEPGENKNIEGLYFDGRKDQTMFIINKRRVIQQEEHISIIEEPGNKYFAHFPVKGPATASNIKNLIFRCLNKHGANFDTVRVIGCDGTNVNTGWKGGSFD